MPITIQLNDSDLVIGAANIRRSKPGDREPDGTPVPPGRILFVCQMRLRTNGVDGQDFDPIVASDVAAEIAGLAATDAPLAAAAAAAFARLNEDLRLSAGILGYIRGLNKRPTV